MTFFEAVFGDLEGYLCISTLKPVREGDSKNKGTFHQEFFRWPEQKPVIEEFIERFVMTHNMYYCPTLFAKPKCVKEEAIKSYVTWADLDSCRWDIVNPEPTIVTETSPNRFQGLWRYEEPVGAYDAEDVNRRIAYAYESEGCDKSGWDLTQRLRIPYTVNHKYSGGTMSGPQVKVIKLNPVQYTLDELVEALPQLTGYEGLSVPMPEPGDLPTESGEAIMQKHRTRLQPIAFHLFSTQPEKDWSAALWQLEMMLVEAGLSLEETFVVAREAKCNKYKRDGTDEVHLWKEVCRAANTNQINMSIHLPGTMEPLLTDEERASVEGYGTFVEEYIEWAKTIGDAAPQYHQAGAFVILSSLLAGPIKLPTSFGTIVPNLWFMILADTTLTRKSTAMDLAMDIVTEIDPEAMLATDGSIEGLFASLQVRPGRPSVFLRDEFSGLLEAMTKKDYYAGMAETFTKLYDGKYQKRVLRKDIIEVKDPVLILFAGGIRERILQLLTYEHVASGFLPRFVFIAAESDLGRIKPLGPPTEQSLEGRQELLDKLTKLHNFYTSAQTITIGEKTVIAPPEWRAEMTPEAWMLYNRLEEDMMKAALASKHPDIMTPVYDRLSKSGLKSALLIAALRMDPNIVVTKLDLLKAFTYVEYWREFALDIIANIGRTTSERTMTNVLREIKRKSGITRSEIMQHHHLNSRDAELILMTLEQRGQIFRVKSGRTERLHDAVAPHQVPQGVGT
jgi:hypothetical protein